MTDLQGSIVASPATRTLARRLIADTQWDGAEATMAALEEIRPQQIPALIHLLAAAASTGEVDPSRGGEDREPITLTPEERRRAHRRYQAGQRDPATRRGERDYQRASKRDRRNRRRAAAGAA
jgi:hypothetical protein